MQALLPFSFSHRSHEAFLRRSFMLWRAGLVTGDTEQKSFDESIEMWFFW